jgi:hypothetical protein
MAAVLGGCDRNFWGGSLARRLSKIPWICVRCWQYRNRNLQYRILDSTVRDEHSRERKERSLLVIL